MEYEFTNGSARQKAIWEEAVGHLLHLPSSAINLKVVVTFQATIPGGHTDLALTTWTYDSAEATTVVRSDALSFGSSQAVLEAEAASLGLPYSIEKFYLESSAHELGHALYASLPEANRIAIAQMFGATSDSIEELQPPGAHWQDRIMEGIAETFKEAFLPRAFRVFPNRTNRKIAYSVFPEFRRLWRVATSAVLRGGEPLGEGEEEVPAYDLDIFKQGGFRRTEQGESRTPTFPPGLEPIGHDDYGYLIGAGGFWDTFFEEVYIWFWGLPGETPTLTGSFLRSEFLWEGWVKTGVTLQWELLLTRAPFELNGVGLHLQFFGPSSKFFDGRWRRADESEAGFALEGDATGFPVPPTMISDSMVVNSTNFGTGTRRCHGVTYRWVKLEGALEIDLFNHVLAEHEALREALLYSWLGSFIFKQALCAGTPDHEGPAIIVPTGGVTPAGATSGAHPHIRPVAGSYG